uniref:Nodule-specific cysteine-rich peptide 314 n=1 Tax=Medicago truncatula TaxID=3880 RepID=A7KHE4_MEDTR|nr:nodule-specific cysteine-rich peptide 314 [Medicago truncatula]
MANTHKLVSMILFIFLFLASNNVEGYVNCETDADCPPSTRVKRFKCVKGECRWTRMSYA